MDDDNIRVNVAAPGIIATPDTMAHSIEEKPPSNLKKHAQVVIVGAGPVGLTLGLGLARMGIRSLILDDDDKLSDGSRAICIQRHTLEIFQRLGAVEPMMQKGVTWTLGRVFFRRKELFQIRFPGSDEQFPPFINLQQSYTEQYLLDALRGHPLCEVRWRHKVTALAQDDDAVTVTAETPEGEVDFVADYVIAADGARSSVRNLLGISFDGHTYPDRFFIADIRARLDFPNERWFWFDPVFNPGKSALVHPQPDGEWRIDWQLGPDVDIEAHKERAALDRLIRATIGDREYEIVWVTTYVFHERLARRFQQGRVFLAGDAAHLVAPFGARGMNSGVQDAYNLIWKLWLTLDGKAPAELLGTYETERRAAAEENVRITDGSMRFITPQTRGRLLQRNAILRGSVWFKRLRPWVNSGRLSTPFVYNESPLIHRTEHLPALRDQLLSPALWRVVRRFKRGPRAGELAPDACYASAEKKERRRLTHLIGHHFLLLYFSDEPEQACRKLKETCAELPDVPLHIYVVSSRRANVAAPEPIDLLWDDDGDIVRQYAARGGSLYLVRPDGHIAARGFSFPLEQLPTIFAQAIGAHLKGASG
jgi:3-(3-hydroxy-phenyl)propionate hydroxylase